MIFPLEKTAMTFIAGNFYKFCFRTISKSAADSSVLAESVAVEDDMVK